ncbi:hypothetical protein AGMMS49982_11880 [Bacteroidia bacterium]|nr:hypothetical protein AGMMS49982_11880 [Bacteroidia bacterium]
MKKDYKNELEDLLVSGRELSTEEFDKLVDSFLGEKSESEKENIGNSLAEVKLSKLKQVKEISEEISILEQLDGMEEFVNFSTISRNYFGKDKSWMYQRLHGYSVHGKPARFTLEEKRKLSNAFLSLSDNLKTVAHKFA